MEKLIITIDGPAGAGKSTIAKRVARELNSTLIDTGAMYRSVACASLLYQVSVDNEKELVKLARKIEPRFNNCSIGYYLNGLYLTPFLRCIVVNSKVSEVSVHKEVRQVMVELQRKIAKESPNGAVLEGRDTGSTVLSTADLKIYLTASIKERVNRRLTQYLKKNIKANRVDVQADLEKRDKIDTEREISPLKVPEGALVIDSTDLKVEEVTSKILYILKQKQEQPYAL